MATLVVHELKNSLNNLALTIGNLADDIERASDIKNKKQYLDRTNTADKEISRFSKIVEGFRDYSRSLWMDDDVKPFYLNDLVKSTLVLITLGRNRRMRIEKDFSPILWSHSPPESRLEVEGDERLIQQVMINLLRNAIDAMNQRGRLRVSTTYNEAADMVSFSVTDYGPGIPQQNHAKIFQPNFSTKKEKGTGLGLFISKYFIEEKHQGNLDFRSQVGKGARFWFVLPRKPQKDKTRNT